MARTLRHCRLVRHRDATSTPESRERVAAQAAKAVVELSRHLDIKVDPQVAELARQARF